MNKIVLIGAGSQNFGLGIIGDIFKSQVLEGSHIVLHDINSETLKLTDKIANSFKEKLNVNYEISSTTSTTFLMESLPLMASNLTSLLNIFAFSAISSTNSALLDTS